jgi:hypothetical protein
MEMHARFTDYNSLISFYVVCNAIERGGVRDQYRLVDRPPPGHGSPKTPTISYKSCGDPYGLSIAAHLAGKPSEHRDPYLNGNHKISRTPGPLDGDGTRSGQLS